MVSVMKVFCSRNQSKIVAAKVLGDYPGRGRRNQQRQHLVVSLGVSTTKDSTVEIVHSRTKPPTTMVQRKPFTSLDHQSSFEVQHEELKLLVEGHQSLTDHTPTDPPSSRKRSNFVVCDRVSCGSRLASDPFHEEQGGLRVPPTMDPREDQNNSWLHQHLAQDLSAFDIVAVSGSIEDLVHFFHFLFRADRVVETWTLDLFLEFWGAFPEAAHTVLNFFQQYECWHQLLLLLVRVQSSKELGDMDGLSDAIYKLLSDQWARDLVALSSKKGSPSDLVHWLPCPRTELDQTLDFTTNFLGRMTNPKAHRTPHSTCREPHHKRHVKALRSAMQNQRGDIVRRIMLPKKGSRTVPDQGMTGKRRESWTNVVYIHSPTLLPPNNEIDLAMSDVRMPWEGLIDELLDHQPRDRTGRDAFLETPIRRFDSSRTERVLYVHQGEVGHATPSQTDVILSDRATTCHILSIQSTVPSSKNDSRVPTLVSLTHLDSDIYTDCIIKVIQQHLDHHKDRGSVDPLQLVVDIVGGFDDARGVSVKISCWLLKLLARLAKEFRDVLTMTLRTCAISARNDDGTQSPVARGMGIDMKTGEVFLAACDLCVAPAMQLRNARIWAGGGHGRLALVHTQSSDRLTIHPFEFGVFDMLPKYLRMPDTKMIRCTSTSPDVEEEDFCTSVRNTLRFMKAIDCQRVFGPDLDRPLVFERVASSNVWRRCAVR